MNFKLIIRRYIGWLLGLTVLAGGIAYLYHTAPPPGYCDITHSITPDDVFIEKALTERNKDIQKTDGKHYSVVNCCLISRMEGGLFAKVIRYDPGVWVSIAYERSQYAIDRSTDKHRYSHAMSYFDSCLRYRTITDDTKGPPFYGHIMPKYNYHRIIEKNEIPVIDKRDIKYFVKWPK